MTADFWRDRRVFLTGHTGFKGSWLTLWLLRMGAEVHGFSLAPGTPSLFNQLGLTDHRSRAELPGRLVHRLGDIRDGEALNAAVDEASPEVVIHMAAQPLVRLSYQTPLETWSTNLMGSLQVLEALRQGHRPCGVVMVTTDKVYQNRDWEWGYREEDRLGGHDPYSASKAAMELAIHSWRACFSDNNLAISTARAGNVIGGGDWACDRIVPDAIRALSSHQPIPVRNPQATRPWQHVLEPLGGYLLLAERLLEAARGGNPIQTCYNLGPEVEAERSVGELIREILKLWPGSWIDRSDPSAPHEAARLALCIDRARQELKWKPRWNFATTIARTTNWYRRVHQGEDPLTCCMDDLEAYIQAGMNSPCP